MRPTTRSPSNTSSAFQSPPLREELALRRMSCIVIGRSFSVAATTYEGRPGRGKPGQNRMCVIAADWRGRVDSKCFLQNFRSNSTSAKHAIHPQSNLEPRPSLWAGLDFLSQGFASRSSRVHPARAPAPPVIGNSRGAGVAQAWIGPSFRARPPAG